MAISGQVDLLAYAVEYLLQALRRNKICQHGAHRGSELI